MKGLYNKLYFGLIIALSLVSCTEIIEFDTDREGGQLVVDGTITTGLGPFELYLGKTAAIERKTIPVDGATVQLFDDQGNSEPYQGQGEGRYLLPGLIIKPAIGRSYFLRIELADGTLYESKKETVPPIWGQLDSVYFNFEKQEELNSYGNIVTFQVVNALVDMSVEQQAGQSSFFRFDVEEVYRLSPTDFPDPFGAIPPPCYISEYSNSRDFLLTDVKGNQTNKLQGLKVATQIMNWRFDEIHYFNVYLQSLTEDGYTYWSQVHQTISNIGTIFDAPPAPVKGNIFNVNDQEEQVLGYFGAVTRDTLRNFLNPSDTPRRPLFDCAFSFFSNDYPMRCLDCLSVPGSSYQRPDYF